MEIKRNQYLQQLIDGKGNHLIKIITGLRRCGKSYLLFNLFPAYLQQNGVPSDHIIKIDLEDIRNTEFRSPLALVRYIDSKGKWMHVYFVPASPELCHNVGRKEFWIAEIDLEDIRNTEFRSPLALVRYIDKLMTDEKMHYILLDEIQHVEKFEEVLNSYLKIKNADIYVTGSNSKFLSSDIVTEFRGRGDEIHMHGMRCQFRMF